MEDVLRTEFDSWGTALPRALDRAFDLLLSLFLFITVFLPGGSIYGYNFKYPVYFLLLPVAAYTFFQRRQATTARLALLVAVPTVLAGWVLLGLYNGFGLPSVLRQYTDILLTLLLCWLVLIFCGQDEGRRLRLLRLVLNAVLATALLKIGLIAYAVLRGIPVVQMVLWLSDVFGVELMTMDLGSLFGRVQFVSDALIPTSIFIILRHRDRLRMSSGRASLSILLLLISVIFSFSRYFWAFTAIAFLLGLLLGPRNRFAAVLLTVLGVTILASLPMLITLYQLRFSTDVAGESDSVRAEQIPALKELFLSAPLLGHGLGSYSTAVVRSNITETGRYAYEVQLLALPAQIGVVGIFFFVLLGGFYYSDLWWRSSLAWSDRLGIELLLACWLSAGLTNPLLFHPVAGVNYATLATLAGVASKERGRLRTLTFGKPVSS